MTAILALDLGTHCGWALHRNGEALSASTVTSGVQDFSCRRFEGGGMRFLRAKRWLDEISNLALPHTLELYYEEVRHHSAVDAAHVYGGLLATLTSWCEEHKIPYQGIPVGTIKKYITALADGSAGKGNANKQQVIDAVRKLGHNPKDDNEADAIALLYTAMQGVKL